jgi:hypothetical protein
MNLSRFLKIPVMFSALLTSVSASAFEPGRSPWIMLDSDQKQFDTRWVSSPVTGLCSEDSIGSNTLLMVRVVCHVSLISNGELYGDFTGSALANTYIDAVFEAQADGRRRCEEVRAGDGKSICESLSVNCYESTN